MEEEKEKDKGKENEFQVLKDKFKDEPNFIFVTEENDAILKQTPKKNPFRLLAQSYSSKIKKSGL